MSTNQNTATYILDQLSSLSPDVRVRKMFGEYALYYHDKVVALICDDILYLKTTSLGKDLLAGEYEEGNPYPKSKPHIKISEEVLNNRELLSQLIKFTYNNLPIKK